MSKQDRRRFPRVETTIEVVYDFGVESFSEYTLNISQGGLYIKTARPLEVGSAIEAEFALPGLDHIFAIPGRVVWKKAVANEEGPPGMGIEFTELSATDRKFLNQFIGQSQLTQSAY